MIDVIELLKDRKILFLLLAFAILTVGLTIYSTYAGLLLLLAFILFGVLSTVWKDKRARFAALAFLLLLSITNIALNGMKFGIDFSGGTRIPIILERSVDQATMDEMVQTIKSRASVLGLTEVKVRAVGTSQIDIEVPGSDENLIQSIEDVLSKQGVFQGIVDGKVALQGDYILPGTISQAYQSQLKPGSDWGVSFSVNKEGAEHFAQTVLGKADYPMYLFLDRPKNAAIFISSDELKSDAQIPLSDSIQAVENVLVLNTGNISLYVLDDLNFSSLQPVNESVALISSSLDQSTKDKLTSLGYNLSEQENITPVISPLYARTGYFVSEWRAIGLLSAPTLHDTITQGIPSYNYMISGSAKGNTATERAQNAQKEVKEIIAILKGGSLPVQISLGSRTSVPAPLGQQFLQLSFMGVLASILAIALFVSIRYRQIKIVAPILAVSISELIILISILGSFTIDLAAMAGILAAIGVGVDAQIVITDELKKKGGDHEEKLNYAFSIITTNVVIAIVAMLPLLFSGLVEVIGFALSTIIGSLLGFLISRPAYALLVEKIID